MAIAGSARPALARLFARVPAALPAPQFERLRAALLVLALLPLARLVHLGLGDALGANPVEFVTRSLGTWALVMLCVTLAITPLRQLTGWAWLARLRRMAGLTCFFYALLHVAAYAVLDHWLDVSAIVADIVKRPYITAGFAAFVMLLPLAATSTNTMVRRLGATTAQAGLRCRAGGDPALLVAESGQERRRGADGLRDRDRRAARCSACALVQPSMSRLRGCGFRTAAGGSGGGARAVVQWPPA